MSGMFIQLWRGLIELSHDNDTDVDIARAKRFINYSISDISNNYDWEFLRGSTSITATAAGVYDVSPIRQLSAQSTVYVQLNSFADFNPNITIGGMYIDGDEFTSTAYTVEASAGATASAAGDLDHIDFISKPITNDSVFITTSGGNIIATLNATDTYLSNDVKKINSVICENDPSRTDFFDWNSQLKNNPSQTNNGVSGYDIDYNSQIRVYSLPASSTVFSIYYQRKPKTLVANNDRSEFPLAFYADIIDYAYKVYAKRYSDEADAVPDTMMIELKNMLIAEIWRKWNAGKDTRSIRVMPAWIKRSV